MRLLELKTHGEFSLTKDLGDDVPRYAILSHTWGDDDEEPTLQDLMQGVGKNKTGYKKILFCGEQAARDGLQYVWLDTCCIDKSNSTELAEAINSMFRWYREAAKCYVYLSDVVISSPCEDEQSSRFAWELAFQKSRWFTRGWTLQELIAPEVVEFFSGDGKRLGDKRSLEEQVHQITKIPIRALQGSPLSELSVTERISWAENRETKRKEDKAYSLMGIFDIHMPLIYGEGRDKAFTRLRNKIDKRSRRLELEELQHISQSRHTLEPPLSRKRKVSADREADFYEGNGRLKQQLQDGATERETLEAKLVASEKDSAIMAEDNERLKRQLQKVSKANEILKATFPRFGLGDFQHLHKAGALRYSPTDFYTEVLHAHENKTPSHRIVTSDTGERLLAAGATWDYIIKHPLYMQGLVDVGDVSDRLKKVAKSDGQGPTFEESEILDAIEKSVASGGDDLL